ncbi:MULTISPECIES: glycine cleavage protein H-like protein [Chlamydia]|uniref:Glycine cleavage system H-like protein n=2 Tax=Chlamydia TaxID=810 RepID=A0ABN0MP08_CHLPS|nr:MULTISPECIES: glycine cleavage protein H-like protein [Chlamydia]AFS19384.1 glycine cleavage system H protein [Chlamydia psittaci 84/55]AFS22580.1 glycine cleavage system H protein [Chlamydia psittaci VS225]AGE74938.1 glycine cleavage system protein H [Chlamydia psittaci Mat116]EPJ15712.1 glycine cleavage H-family protein [Chlamydia psittaci 02DC18]EPJ16925.1 glycine cleavage H-family protein [Chlamydia psittaci 02DC22]EPJ20049.1 glycine cleavage H-family protein [Chlamydia psittaci 02DC21
MWYSDYHVWIDPIHEDIVRLGLTSRMRENLGQILHIDLPDPGSFCKEGEVLVILESSKSAIEVLSPVSGEILEVNENLKEDVRLLNHSPEEAGWFVIVKLDQKLNIQNLSPKE